MATNKKKFGDKFHQFLRRIGIKETQTVNLNEAMEQLGKIAKSKGTNYYSIYVEFNSINGCNFRAYVDPRKSSKTEKSIDAMFTSLNEQYEPNNNKSTVEEIIL